MSETYEWPQSKLVPGDWRPWQKAPASLGKPGAIEALEKELEEVSAALIPITEQEFTQALKPLFYFARTFGVPTDKPAATSLYWQEMRGHPRIAIVEAISTTLGRWNNSSRLPMPQEITQNLPLSYRLTTAVRWRIERALVEAKAGRIQEESSEFPL